MHKVFEIINFIENGSTNYRIYFIRYGYGIVSVAINVSGEFIVLINRFLYIFLPEIVCCEGVVSFTTVKSDTVNTLF